MTSINEVVVGNIGTVYSGPSSLEAHRVYLAYRDQSVSGSGRAGGEDVTWLRDGEVYAEHEGAADPQGDDDDQS